MATNNNAGIYQKDNGYWEYRFVMMVDGKKVNKKKSTDAFGNKLKTKREAIKAREAAMAAARLDPTPKPKVHRRMIKDVYAEYCEKGRKDRAYQTIRKQDSLWENHLSAKFGTQYVDEVTAAEVMDYLAELYYIHNFSYQYTESFLKMFYLIFGQAYSRNYLDVDNYNRLCVNKDTKIRMPKQKSDDDNDIAAFSKEQLSLLDKYFKGTHAETAYLLGRYCGLRINEAFGLKWDNIDLENGTITIDRQMQYQNGLIKLIAPKTRNSTRVVYMSHVLKVHLEEKAMQRKDDEIQLSALREQNRRLIEDIDGNKIYSTELVNCLPNGRIQSVNAMKYPTREIKKKLGIDFKFHFLRHTYGTLMAEMNTPTHLLCNQMGHGNIHVTQKYYIAISKSGVEILQNNINSL
jgi:integrase